MPYASKDRREALQLSYKAKGSPQVAGELNYLFTIIAQRYLKEHGLNYQHINDCIGALEGAKLELYRRIVAPYEDTKIEENGDVNILEDI